MQVRENLAMDQSGTIFSQRKTYQISRFTLIFIASIFICSIIATALLIYNFATCDNYAARMDHRDNSHVISLNNGHNHGITSNIHTDGNRTTADVNLRLPRSIVPISYDIKLIPFLYDNNFTFSGEIKIRINVTESCKNITLHAMALTIRNSDVIITKASADGTSIGNKLIEIKSQYFVESKQFYIIELNEMLQNGSLYVVEIKYGGVLNDLLQGFYRSSYTIGNESRWVAATQFQPTDARRALPCFDEPALKARFKLTLARPRSMTTLSNMPQIGQSPVIGMPDYEWDEYMETVPMSTYLLAFTVTDFNYTRSGNFSVWTRPDVIRSAEYALSIGPKILKFYEDYFGLPYPLPKMDMIALPDFTAGAMENWGLITYRETAMLYEEGVSARINKMRVASVVAHELAHQWFGNICTPSWWSDLWLNEGFATYMEYVGVDAVEPTWKSMDLFVLSEVQGVFTLDALSTSHKIWIEVHDPDEINEIFDRISYGKGASIIRMMDHFITPKVFKEGLKSFLKAKQYQAADQNDLWQYLTDEARRSNIFDNSTSVKEIMDTWTLQAGFPIVNVTVNYDTQTIELSQKRFAYADATKRAKTHEKDEPLWWVPISYTTAERLNFNDTKPVTWIRKTPTLKISDADIAPEDWILVNIQQTGYFRVNYDKHNWKLLTTYLQNPKTFSKIAPANRAQLVDDALNLARGGSLDYGIAMNITKYLAHENDYVPWKAAIYSLNFIDSMMIKGGEYYKFKKYVMSLIEHVYNDVQFNDPPEADLLTGLKRVDVVTTACHFGYEDCVKKCSNNFAAWMMEGNPDINNPVSPNLRPTVYCTAIKYGDQKEWDFAWERYQTTNVPSEKEILLSAMGCSRETWILRRFLERSLTDKYGIRKHDVFRVVASVSSNVLGQPIAFNFIRTHWELMKEYLGANLSNLNSIVKYTARRLNNRYELDEFKRFTHQHTKDTGRTIQQAIEAAESNIQWMERNYKTIIEWLGNIKYANS